MKIATILFFGTLVFLSSIVFGQEDDKFEQFLSEIGKANAEELNRIIARENKLFESTENVFHQYNAKFAQSFKARLNGNITEGLRLLIWIDEQCPDCHSNQFNWVRYEIGCTLGSLKVYRLSQEYFLPLATEKKPAEFKLKFIAQDMVAANYLEMNDYKKALYYYQRSLEHYQQIQNWLMVASILNNIGICYLELGKNEQSLVSFQSGLKAIEKAKKKSTGDFEYILIGNIGTCYDSLGRYPDAISNLTIEFDYFLKNGDRYKFLAGTFKELIELYIKTKNVSEANKIIERFAPRTNLFLTQKNKSFEAQMTLQALLKYYSFTGDIEKNLLYTQLLIKKQTEQMKFNEKQTYTLNEILYINKLRNLKSTAKIQRIESQQSKVRMKLFLVIFTLVILMLIGIVIVSNRFNRQKKEALLKDKLIAQQHSEILEDDLKIQREKTNNLAFYLNLKRETEKAFLNKITELKKRKNTNTETVLKDLQLSVSNLIHVDKKAILESTETSELLDQFKKNLSTLHPILSKTDLEYCCYFRLGMSAKEIGSFFGRSDVSIRVIKNKIKNKLELNVEVSLNDYLQSISRK